MGIVYSGVLYLELFLCIFSFYTREIYTLVLATVLIFTQNILGILLAGSNMGELSQASLLLKELVVYGTVVAAAVLGGASPFLRLGKAKRPIQAYIVFIIAYIAISGAPLMARVACFRTLFTPIVLILFGLNINITRNEFISFQKGLTVACVVALLFGIGESYFFGSGFWVNLGMPEFNIIKGFEEWTNSQGIADSFYSYDFYEQLGFGIRRMASFIAEPIAFGHIMALAYSILLFDYNSKIVKTNALKSLLAAIFLFGAIASLSKGAILICGLSSALRIFDFKNPLTYVLLLLTFTGVMYLMFSSSAQSLTNHSEGLTGAFSGHLILGDGVGTGGNYAGLYGGNETEGAESFLGSIIVQIGLPGALCFVIGCTQIARSILSSYPNFKTFKAECPGSGGCIFAFGCLIESIMSESAVGFIASGVGLIILGIVLRDSFDSSGMMGGQ